MKRNLVTALDKAVAILRAINTILFEPTKRKLDFYFQLIINLSQIYSNSKTRLLHLGYRQPMDSSTTTSLDGLLAVPATLCTVQPSNSTLFFFLNSNLVYQAKTETCKSKILTTQDDACTTTRLSDPNFLYSHLNPAEESFTTSVRY
jgi:hypothetical protein